MQQTPWIKDLESDSARKRWAGGNYEPCPEMEYFGQHTCKPMVCKIPVNISGRVIEGGWCQLFGGNLEKRRNRDATRITLKRIEVKGGTKRKEKGTKVRGLVRME